MSNSQRIGRASLNVTLPAPAATVAPVVALVAETPKPTVTLAPISALTAATVGKSLARAANTAEGAQRTLLGTVASAVAQIGVPLTASQWSKQVAPSIKAAFKATRGSKLTEERVSQYMSRFKTCGLAILCGDASLQPYAGETLGAFYDRVNKPLETATLPDGRKVRDGAKPGAKARPSAPTKGTGAGSKGAADDTEGGMSVRPFLAAALILTEGNAPLAAQLAIAAESYRDEMARWLDGILTDADKSELQASVA